MEATFDLNIVIIDAVAILVAIAVLLLIRKFINYYYSVHRIYEQTVFLVKIPKDRPSEQQGSQQKYVQQLHEEIARGETLFNAIGSLRSERGLIPWLFGHREIFSFEIVAYNKTIGFYIVVPAKFAHYVEQQVSAYYPEAVIEVVEDYNIFKPNSYILAAYAKTLKDFIFPIKTFNKSEVDPMNSIINHMSKLDADEGVAFQIVAKSSHPSWHYKAKHIVKTALKKNSVREALRYESSFKFLTLIWEILDLSSVFQTKKDPNKIVQQPQKRLTGMEEEMLKLIEGKNSKAGLDVNIRIIVSSPDQARARLHMHNMYSALNELNYYQYGNVFRSYPRFYFQKKLIKSFIHRRFIDSTAMILNTEEICTMWHIPTRETQTPNILWLTAKSAPAPTDIPEEGILLGYNNYRGIRKQIHIKREDRRRHSYIIGKSGVGKSQLMTSMAIQDIMNGEGVCVLDPHGDLIESILKRIPPERSEDVILFAPADTERPLGLNLIEFDQNYPEQKTFVINEMIKIFDKLYDLKATGGPIFEQYMRNALLLIMADPASGSTLMEIPRVLADADFRKMKLEKCYDMTVTSFWKNEAEKAGGEAALANIVPYITSKLTSFISNDLMRPIIGQQKSAFNMRQVMDSGKILLINLSKGSVGELNAYLLGMVLIGKILMSSLSRTDIPEEQRKDFYLYIDEFQNFTTDSICSILSEARKYKLNLIIAHQYIGQLVKGQDTSIRDAVFGNVGTWMSFKVGSEDAQVLEKEFTPVFNQFDLINVDKYTALTKLLVDNAASRPFTMNTPWPLPGIARDEIVPRLKALSRLKYGQDRNIIEAEIKRRWKGI